MKRTTAGIFLVILFTVFVSDRAVYSKVDKKKSIISEIKYSPKKSDIYFYCNVSELINFYKKNGISSDDIQLMLDDNKDGKSKETQLLRKIYNQIDEIALIGNSAEIQKSSGLLVICKLKKPVKVLSRKLKKLTAEKVKGGKIYLYDKVKNLYLFRNKNTYIFGFKPFLVSYLKSQSSKKTKLSAVQTNVIKNSKGKTIYFNIVVSKMMKEKMKIAMEKGAQFGKGLSANVFVKSIINMQSLEGALTLAGNVKLLLGMEASTPTDGKRLVMVSHFMIVATSFAVSFADMFARSFGKKGLKATPEKIEKIQAIFGRIKTRATRKGVQLSFQLSKAEKNEFILSMKKAFEEKKEARKIKERESRLAGLFSAIRSGNEAAVTDLLKKYGNVNAESRKKETPLFFAVKYGKHNIIKLLLGKGADVNGKIGKAQLTPLQVAAQRNDVEAIKILIEKGAKIDVIDKNGNTAFHYALKYTALKSAQYLLEKGANINTITASRESTLYNSVKAGYTDIIKAIINKGADVNTQSANGISPLHMAAMKGNVEVIKLLISKGAVINSTTKRGTTPLHYAAENGKLEAVKVLVEAGAAVAVKDKDGNTPSDKAQHNGNYKISEYLEGKIKK